MLAGSATKAFPIFGVTSKSEEVPAKWVTKDSDIINRLRELSTRFNYRVYPAFFRTDSSNYDPMPGWLLGGQMVALNFQTNDMPLRLNRERFLTNGNCGYALKPAYLRGGVEMLRQSKTLSDFYGRSTLTIKVICGLLLPRPAALPKETKMQPVCVVILHGTYEEPTAPHDHHNHHHHPQQGGSGQHSGGGGGGGSSSARSDNGGGADESDGASSRAGAGMNRAKSFGSNAALSSNNATLAPSGGGGADGGGGTVAGDVSEAAVGESRQSRLKRYTRRVSPTELWQYTDASDNGLVPEWNTTFTFISTSPQVAMVSVYVYHSTVFNEANFAGGSSAPLLAMQRGVRAVPIVPTRSMNDPAGRFDPLPPPTCVMVDVGVVHEPLKLGKGIMAVESNDLM